MSSNSTVEWVEDFGFITPYNKFVLSTKKIVNFSLCPYQVQADLYYKKITLQKST